MIGVHGSVNPLYGSGKKQTVEQYSYSDKISEVDGVRVLLRDISGSSVLLLLLLGSHLQVHNLTTRT
jgi:hypothetical protein